LFGDLDAALVPEAADPVAAACQLSVANASTRCLGAQLAALQRCKKARRTSFGAGDLASCAASVAEDAAVRRACDAGSSRLARATGSGPCQGTDLAAGFPGCAAASDGGLAACAGEHAACRACRAVQAVHGLGGDCAACP
jgi:hypothetical protein